jgi:hypothetical protein
LLRWFLEDFPVGLDRCFTPSNVDDRRKDSDPTVQMAMRTTAVPISGNVSEE